MAPSHLEIVRVVRGRHFDGARSEFAVHGSVGDHGNLAIHQREKKLLADQMLIALVRGIYRHGGIAQHGFRARGGDDDRFARAHHRIANVPEMAVALLVDRLEIAQGRLATRAPVDDVPASIDQPFVVKAQKSFQNRAVERRIERELFARPIAGVAQANHLLLDRAAAVRLPFPNAPFELFASESFAREALLGQFAFHDDLRRNAGVVHARQPQRVFAAHAVPAREHVDLRVLEHVADVDVAGDVRRRNDDRKHVAGRICIGAEQFLLHPSLGPARLNQLRLVNFGEFGALGRRFRCLFWRIFGQVYSLRSGARTWVRDKPLTIRSAARGVKSQSDRRHSSVVYR